MTDPKQGTKNYIRGGQIILHNLRMFNQVTLRVIVVGLLVYSALIVLTLYINSTPYLRYIFSEWLWAHFYLFFNGAENQQHIIQPNGQSAVVYSQSFIDSNLMNLYLIKIKAVLLKSVLIGSVFSSVVIIGIIVFLKRWGGKQTKNNQIKGDFFEEDIRIKKIIEKKRVASDLTLGNVCFPLIKDTERQHILLDGTTGAGKSNAIKELLDHIRRRGDRVVLWDEGGNYLREFYDEKRDKIVNDLDIRGQSWSPWNECIDIADFENMAMALIPMTNTQDPFWVLAARSIFAEVAYAMRNDPSRSVKQLLKVLLTSSLDNIKQYIENTYASILVSDKIEKTAISIKSIMAAYLKCLRYVKEEENPFSIRKWVRGQDSDGWLFFSSVEKKHEALKPLITARIDLAINELLSLPENKDRRIFFIFDELVSLNKLPTLSNILAKGRKPGACIVIGIQNYAQLAEVYSSNGAKTISSLLNTRLIFRQPDPDMAAWSARNLGESIIEEVKEGVSYGANSTRDGVSINKNEIRKPLVSLSEIINLPDLECYLRLPGHYPITKLKFNFKKRYSVHAPFFQREINDADMHELDTLIKKYEKAGTYSTSEEAAQNNSSATGKNNINKNDSVKNKDYLFTI